MQSWDSFDLLPFEGNTVGKEVIFGVVGSKIKANNKIEKRGSRK